MLTHRLSFSAAELLPPHLVLVVRILCKPPEKGDHANHGPVTLALCSVALLTMYIFCLYVHMCGDIGPSQPSYLDTGCLPDLRLGSQLVHPSSHPVSAPSMGDTDATAWLA